ncbi:hypothetical protein GCM10009819_22040 [Agromyces tropicus]|uniref:DUF4229 domain-containing protein n=1 Tax=Agromyces tropicus TaxID=555371 RepID=A0ABP5FZ89_9MICO
MTALPAWLRYTLLRVLLFVAPLVVLLVAGVVPWIAVLVAALFGFSASLIFLRRSREQLASDLYAARHRETPAATVDDEAEDSAIEEAERHESEHHADGHRADGPRTAD